MKRVFLTVAILAAAGGFGFGAAAFAAGSAPAAPAAGSMKPDLAPRLADVTPEIVATVNGKALTRDQLGALCIHLYGKEALETLILHEAIRQEAAKQGITVTQEEVDAYVKKAARQRLDAMAQRSGALDLMDWGAKKGMAPEAIAHMLTEQEYWLRPFGAPELLGRRILAKTIQVTEADVRAEFERRYGAKAKVLQIVLRSKADAADAIQKLNLGADFAELAREVSEDPVSRRAGGEIPPLSHGSALGDAAFKLKVGQVSDPIQTPDGYHVLKLLEMTPAAADKRFEDVKDALRDSVVERRTLEQREKWVDELLAKAAITRNL